MPADKKTVVMGYAADGLGHPADRIIESYAEALRNDGYIVIDGPGSTPQFNPATFIPPPSWHKADAIILCNANDPASPEGPVIWAQALRKKGINAPIIIIASSESTQQIVKYEGGPIGPMSGVCLESGGTRLPPNTSIISIKDILPSDLAKMVILIHAQSGKKSEKG